MSMRTAPFLAALAAGALSLGLMSPAGAASGERIVGRANCAGGGTIRIAGSLDKDGNAKAVAHLWGVDRAHWGGGVMAGLDQSTMDNLDNSDPEDLVHTYVADHGELTVVAKQPGATTPTAVAAFMTPKLSRMCMVSVVQDGKKYAVTGMLEGLAVATGQRQAVAAFAMGETNHTYRLRFTLTGKGGHVQTRVVEKTVKKGDFGLQVTVRDFKRLSSFKRVAVRIVDLSSSKTKPQSYAIVH